MDEDREIFKGRIVTVRLERAVLPNGGERVYEVVRHPGGAAVVAVDHVGRVCLLRQWRHAVGGWLWELPAGKLDVAGEPPEAAAARELEEEAGLVAKKWESLGQIVSTPGFSDEILYLFLATDLSGVDTAHEEGEFIEVVWTDFGKALEMASQGEITDAKTIVGLFRATGRAVGDGRRGETPGCSK